MDPAGDKALAGHELIADAPAQYESAGHSEHGPTARHSQPWPDLVIGGTGGARSAIAPDEPRQTCAVLDHAAACCERCGVHRTAALNTSIAP
eukprot:30878-Rhodomonas_salina.2